MNLERLKEPFAVNEVSWRIGQAGKSGDRIWAKVLAYIDNRCIQDRLDEIVGPANWKNEYSKGPEGGVLCGLSIKIDGEWVTKWDGAENSDIEAVKGGLSDAMKRAAVQWGIGRYLYELGESFADVLQGKEPGANYANCKIKSGGKEEYATFYWLPPKNVLPGPKREQPEPPRQPENKRDRERRPARQEEERPPARKIPPEYSQSQVAEQREAVKHAQAVGAEHGIPTGEQLAAIPAEWQAKYADARVDVLSAKSREAVVKLTEGWTQLGMPEVVKAALRPLISKRIRVLADEAAQEPAMV